MAAEAIRGYLESLAKDGLTAPPERPATSDAVYKGDHHGRY